MFFLYINYVSFENKNSIIEYKFSIIYETIICLDLQKTKTIQKINIHVVLVIEVKAKVNIILDNK